MNEISSAWEKDSANLKMTSQVEIKMADIVNIKKAL